MADELANVDEAFGASPPPVQAHPASLRGISPFAVGIQPYVKPDPEPEKPPEGTLPNVDEAFGGNKPPSWAATADHAMQASIMRIQNAFGIGASAEFGSQPIESPLTAFSPETAEKLRSSGIWSNYTKGEFNPYKIMLEGGMDAAAAALAIGNRTALGLLGGVAEATGKAAEEVGLAAPGTATGEYGLRGAINDPSVLFALTPYTFSVPNQLAEFKAAQKASEISHEAKDISSAYTMGKAATPVEETQNIFMGGTPEETAVRRAADLHTNLNRYRANGVIGETEATFRGTIEPTPVQQAARDAAAVEHAQATEQHAPTSNVPASLAPLPVPDIHAVVRSAEPELFQQYDSLQTRQETYRSWLKELGDARAESPQVTAAQAEIDTILGKVNGVEERLTGKQAERIADFRQQIETYTTSDTPDMVHLRQELQKNDYQLRDLAPRVAATYSKANSELELTPGARPVLATPEPAGYASKLNLDVTSGRATAEEVAQLEHEAAMQSAGVPLLTAKREAEVEATRKVAVEALAKSTAGTPEPIITDVVKKLLAAGRSQEEADASASVVQAHYETRAARFGGARGTAAEMYARDGAGIEGAEAGGRKGAAQGKTVLRDGRAIITLFKKADASTFIHETGHHWLNELMGDAKDEAAPAQLRADATAVREWLGATPDGELTTRQHEKFARGFERYFMEGRAPSSALMRVFDTFKRWLTQIYQTTARLRSPITDDIRQVFDRLLTSSDRPIITPDRPVPKSIHDIHEEEAVATPPERASAVADHVRSEIDQTLKEKAPEVADEIRAGRPSGEPATDTSVPGGGNAPKPVPGENGTVEESRAVPESRDQTPEESARAQADPDAKLRTELDNIDKAGNIRLDNLNSTEAVNETLKEFAEKNNGFIQARRGTVTDQEIIDFAQANGLSTSEINIDKLRSMSTEDGIPLAARILGGRQMLVQSAKAVHALMQGDDELAYAEAAQRHLRIQETISGITAEWGRAGRAFRKMGEEAAKAEDLSDFLMANTGRTLFQIKGEMKAGKRLDSPGKVAGFLHDVRKPSMGEMLMEGFVNWLISGPLTHLQYTEGNLLFMLYRAGPEALARAAVGAAHEALLGKPIERVRFGEVASSLHAFTFGQANGLRAAYSALKAGQTMALPGEEAAGTLFTSTKNIPGVVGSVIRAPGERMVAPLHSYARTVGYETSRAGLIYRQAASEGLEGEALTARIAELTNHTPDEITAAAVKEATEGALMGKTGDFTRRWKAVVGYETELPFLGRTQPLKFIQPFISIAGSINKLALVERSPLGVVTKQWRDDMMGRNGVFAQDTAIAKVGLGTAFGGAVMYLRSNNLLNGPAPSDPTERSMMLMTEGIPYGLHIGNMTYQSNRIGVLGMHLAVASSMYDAVHMMSEGDLEKASVGLVHSVTQSFLDEGYASGIADLLRAVEDSDRYGEGYVRNFLSTALVPFSVGSAQIAHITDPYMRETRDLVSAAQAKLPGLSQSLKAKYDIWGQPIPNNAFWGVYARQVEQDPVNQALLRVGVFPGQPDRTIRGVKLTDDQYEAYQQLAGSWSKIALAQIVTQPGFDTWEIGQQEEVIRKTIASQRNLAASQIMAENLDIPDAAAKAKSDKATKGTPSAIARRTKYGVQ